MTPKVTRKDSQNDLFKVRLETLCDPQHALIRLADTIAWKHLDSQLQEHFCTSNGAPALPTRLVAALMYLQHTYNLSDEQIVVDSTVQTNEKSNQTKLRPSVQRPREANTGTVD